MKNRLLFKVGKVAIGKQIFGEPILLENIEIDISGEMDTESFKAQLGAGQENLGYLAAFLKPYLTKLMDMYITDVTK